MQLVAKKLLARGVKPLRIDKASEFTDPVIWITGSIYIQIGCDYVVIFKNKVNSMSTYNCSLKIDDIMDKLKEAIDEGKA